MRRVRHKRTPYGEEEENLIHQRREAEGAHNEPDAPDALLPQLESSAPR